jgi:ABC-type multidrug transport system fused ATPase/permease subunit
MVLLAYLRMMYKPMRELSKMTDTASRASVGFEYDPSSATVSIDGADIRKYTLKSLRDQISFVLQDTLLFHAPVWQNIAYGRPQASRADIVRAAELAKADEFIKPGKDAL